MMKRLRFGGGVGLLCLLFLVKVLLSGLYLKKDPIPMAKVGQALAEEKTTAVAPLPDPAEELRKKEEELKQREEQIKKKEAELLPLEKEIENKMAELNDLQTRLTAFAKQLAQREKALNDSKMSHLVTLYSSMEPVKAAAIMDKLKIETVVLILRHMKGKAAGQILGMMSPEKGAQISERLSQLD